jgi:phasin family protein
MAQPVKSRPKRVSPRKPVPAPDVEALTTESAIAAVLAASAPPPVEVADAPVTAPAAAEEHEEETVTVAPVEAEPLPVVAPIAAIPSPDQETDRVTATGPQSAKGFIDMTDTIETTKKLAEDAKIRLEGFVAEFNEKAKAAMEKSSKAIEELSDLAKGNLEAVVESSKIAAKGVESIGQDAAEYGRKSFEKTSATFKSFAAVKSPAEFFQLQSELMTSTFDTMAAEAAKTSETMLKLAGEIAQPISNRVAIVSEKIKTIAA